MVHVLESKSSDCKNCYKCIRHCPVKSISFANGKATIIQDDCVLCGRCFLVCPQRVKEIRDDMMKVKMLLRSGSKVVVSLAPSFVSYYSNTDLASIEAALKTLGFSAVEETAIGATIVKKAYDEMLEDGSRDVVISTCCHTINLLIQKHYPKAVPFMADVLSPMLAHGKDIKSRYGADTKVVFVGPCIAKKDEADKNPVNIDAVLTFPELDRFLKTEGIELAITGKPTERVTNSKARLFPTTGGVLGTMERSNKKYDYIAIDGVENSSRVLEDVIAGRIHNCFIEMSACQGSCVNGPCTIRQDTSIVSSTLAIQHAAGSEDFTDGVIGSEAIARRYNPINVVKATPAESDIERTLAKMGKADPAKRLNCGSCGYMTCRDKAIAVIQGKAVREMCLPYLMEKAESFNDKIVGATPNGIMVLDEDLTIQLVNRSMCRIIGISEAGYVLHRPVTSLFDSNDFVDALEGQTVIGRKRYLSDYNKYVENTVVHDQKSHVLICIMRDITVTELAQQKREEVLKRSVEITNEVIQKNMRSVQEIASLLGESAAETKVALSSLKETLKDD